MKLLVALLCALALACGSARAQSIANVPYAGSPGTGAPSTADQIVVHQGVAPGNSGGNAARMTLGTLQGLIGGLPFSGGTLTGPITAPGITSTGNASVAGTLGVTGVLSTKRVQQVGGVLSLTANGSCSAGQQWWCSFVYAQGTISGGSFVNSIQVQDSAISTTNVVGLQINQNVAPNGSSAAGPRIAFGAHLLQVGAAQGGTITNSGISSGGVIDAWGETNVGGTSSNYLGGLNGFNATCEFLTGATFEDGCSGVESDFMAQTGTSYQEATGFLAVNLPGNAVEGYLNSNSAYTLGSSVSSSNNWMYALRVGGQATGLPLDPYGRIIYAQSAPTVGAFVIASGVDFGSATVKAFADRSPFRSEVPIQASAITGATRLTSDGGAASSFVYDVKITNRGAGYTSDPTVTVTGCTGAALNAAIGLGGVIGRVGVYAPGSACASNATATLSGGGGSGAAVTLGIAGNTLNFAPNSSVDFACRVSAYSASGDGIGWNIDFGATQGSSPSTTAIVGSPTWTQAWATASAAGKIGIAAPVADTTLGAVNITITPTSGTWNIGGNCNLTKTSQT